ncbi:MAG: N-acetylmuramoyl-L-alanine amidase [Planctomycetes bacterium]|nr:N-acetylmuramoyl-L-alanine amidase [Planctomycetota bacterium]
MGTIPAPSSFRRVHPEEANMRGASILLALALAACGGGGGGGEDLGTAVAGTVTVPPAPKPEKPPTTWSAAYSGNYTSVSYDRGIQYVVIHTIEGTAAGAISWFKNPDSNVSAHYVVDYGGAITQMVQDKDIAWHAGNWDYNVHSIGIEHAGYAYKNYWTAAEYQKSAALTRWICLTYGVPMDRAHIIGHVEVPGATHTDPGPYFNWNYYMSLVKDEPADLATSYKAMEVTTSTLNVRSGPSTSYSVIGTVLEGQRYVRLSSSGGWSQIQYKGNVGWCYDGYLTQKTGVTGILVTSDALNVRSGPGTEYAVVGTVAIGQRYALVEGANGWKKIWWGGEERWVYGGSTSDFAM